MRTPIKQRKNYRSYQEAETAAAQTCYVNCPTCGTREPMRNDEGLCSFCRRAADNKRCAGFGLLTSLVNGYCGICRGVRIDTSLPISTQQAMHDTKRQREFVPGGKRIPIRQAALETKRRE